MFKKFKFSLFIFKMIHTIIYFCERKVSLLAVQKIQFKWNTLYLIIYWYCNNFYFNLVIYYCKIIRLYLTIYNNFYFNVFIY